MEKSLTSVLRQPLSIIFKVLPVWQTLVYVEYPLLHRSFLGLLPACGQRLHSDHGFCWAHSGLGQHHLCRTVTVLTSPKSLEGCVFLRQSGGQGHAQHSDDGAPHNTQQHSDLACHWLCKRTPLSPRFAADTRLRWWPSGCKECIGATSAPCLCMLVVVGQPGMAQREGMYNTL